MEPASNLWRFWCIGCGDTGPDGESYGAAMTRFAIHNCTGVWPNWSGRRIKEKPHGTRS